MLTRVLYFLACSVSPILHAQAIPTESRLGDLKIGGGVLHRRLGLLPPVQRRRRLLQLRLSSPHWRRRASFISSRALEYLYEKTYEVGGRYYRIYRKFVPYAKVMYGRGVFNFPACRTVPAKPGLQPDGRRPRRRLQSEAMALRPRRRGVPDTGSASRTPAFRQTFSPLAPPIASDSDRPRKTAKPRSTPGLFQLSRPLRSDKQRQAPGSR